jgi:hypothetical protein|mmetsp:Transcript_15896/g.34360  ORF Transcript_15896/g.34360 Transcript_15896/m.34360 type:complete len:368 (-) Transcript_15896:236-1339(-)|eukprot:scaffold13762_cov193-Alexandrium_tamarense.AAC.2
MKFVSSLALMMAIGSSAFQAPQLTSRPSTELYRAVNGGLPTFNPSSRDRAQNEYRADTPKSQFPYVCSGDKSSELAADSTAFPKNLNLQMIQGQNARLTYKMPEGADRVQMFINSNGRPLKARVELWCGPIRRTHFMDIDCMNGAETPFRATLKFKNVDSAGPQVLQINTKEDSAFPAMVGVDIMSPERSAERQEKFDAIWKSSTKIYSQGDKTIRSIPIADNCKSVQLLVWSKDVGKKSFKVNIELLQGPNSKRQYYELQCGGGSQPYHAVFETPGNGWTMRVTNTKTLHDGSHEFVLVPYEVDGDMSSSVSANTGAISPFDGGYSPNSTHGGNYGKSLGPHGSRESFRNSPYGSGGRGQAIGGNW